MSAEVFLDTNIFVYHVDDSDPRKLQIASSIVLDAVRAGNACISTQVIQEWITVVLRKSSTDLSISDIRRYVARTLVPMVVPFDVPRLYDLDLSIHETKCVSLL